MSRENLSSGFQLGNMSSGFQETWLRVSNWVGHKQGCTTTEDGYRLEISDLGSTVIILSMKLKQVVTAQLSDLHLCFRI